MANPSGRWTRWGAVALLAFAAAVPTGCASTGNGGEGGGSRSDDIPLVVKILALPFFVLFALAGCGGDGDGDDIGIGFGSDDCCCDGGYADSEAECRIPFLVSIKPKWLGRAEKDCTYDAKTACRRE